MIRTQRNIKTSLEYTVLIVVLFNLFFASCNINKNTELNFIEEQIKNYSYIKYGDSLHYKELNGSIYKDKFIFELDTLVLSDYKMLLSIEIDHSFTNDKKGKRKYLFSNAEKSPVSFVYDIDYKFIKAAPVICNQNNEKSEEDFLKSLEIFSGINTFLKKNQIYDPSVINKVLTFIFGDEIKNLTHIVNNNTIASVKKSIDSYKTNKEFLNNGGYQCCLETLLDEDELIELENKMLFPTNHFGIVSCVINDNDDTNRISFGYHYYECNIALY